MIIDASFDTNHLVEALARLKGIPVSKVVRNASKDFAQGAYNATPVAKISKSEYYYVKDQGRYLHQSQLEGRKRLYKHGIYKVRVRKGWSKASWIGVFRALGMSANVVSQRLPQKVETLSGVVISGTPTDAKAAITDCIRFDGWGGGSDRSSDAVRKSGFALAAKRIEGEVNRMIARQWSGR